MKNLLSKFKKLIPRAELHTHLGSAVDPAILWEIAHSQGIKLPSKDYWDFEAMITMQAGQRNKSLDEMHNKFFYWTELIQSSPEAIEASVKSVIGGGYRKCNLTLQEMRFNPMFRNRKGERDLDHIIKSALWGVDRAVLEYPQVRAGIILMMDRMLTLRQNEIILHKAIKYKSAGVVGLDLAGPARKSFSIKRHTGLFLKARASGLGLTVHTGEVKPLSEMWYVVKTIKPNRIGHGIICVKDKELMKALVRQRTVLEICPTSNLKNSVVKDVGELKNLIRMLLRHKVKFCLNTDGPEMYRTNVLMEEEFLKREKILSEKELVQCRKNAFAASFLK